MILMELTLRGRERAKRSLWVVLRIEEVASSCAQLPRCQRFRCRLASKISQDIAAKEFLYNIKCSSSIHNNNAGNENTTESKKSINP